MAHLPPKAAGRSRERIDRYRHQLSHEDLDAASPDTSHRSRVPRSGSASAADSIMDEIRRNWPFVLEDNFQEVPLALALLEGNGYRTPRSFQDTLDRLDAHVRALANGACCRPRIRRSDWHWLTALWRHPHRPQIILRVSTCPSKLSVAQSTILPVVCFCCVCSCNLV